MNTSEQIGDLRADITGVPTDPSICIGTPATSSFGLCHQINRVEPHDLGPHRREILRPGPIYCKGVDTEGRGRVLEFLWFSVFLVIFLFGVRPRTYFPGPSLESAFLWRISVDRNLPVWAVHWDRIRLGQVGVLPGRRGVDVPNLRRMKSGKEGRLQAKSETDKFDIADQNPSWKPDPEV